jgi:carbamoyltransferase
MPFAPVILEEFFEEFMLTRNQTMQPFYYMAMTCDVKPAQKGRIPAVVHIDGTARPQVVSRSSNLFLYSVLRNFHHITGVPVLVNTSFNIHEEPINGVIEDSLKCLKLGVIDSLVTTKGLYQLA